MIVCYAATSIMLYNNHDIIEYIGNYDDNPDYPDADYFIVQMGLITAGYSLLISLLLSLFPFRQLSTTNRHNPF